MDKKEIVANLTKMRQQYILNRNKKREEKKFVEETSQPLLSFRRKGNKLIVSGDSYSVRKINEAGPILEYLEEILLLNEAPEEGRRYVCQGEENNEEFIPKLFCQVGDKKRGWAAKPVEKMASLLFTIMDAGQGGSITLSDKSKPKPDWFNADAGWNTYTQQTL